MLKLMKALGLQLPVQVGIDESSQQEVLGEVVIVANLLFELWAGTHYGGPDHQHYLLPEEQTTLLVVLKQQNHCLIV